MIRTPTSKVVGSLQIDITETNRRSQSLALRFVCDLRAVNPAQKLPLASEDVFARPHFIGLIGGGLPREIAPGTCGAQACFVNEPLAACEAMWNTRSGSFQTPELRKPTLRFLFSHKAWRLCYRQALIGMYIILAMSKNTSTLFISQHLLNSNSY